MNEENLIWGDLGLNKDDKEFDEVLKESERQVKKWDYQRRSPAEWMLFLTEEVGDLAEATAFFTSDTQFCPHQIEDFYLAADIIFQDCETYPFKSGVHAHYDELKTLREEYKSKMWLYHYNPIHPQFEHADSEDNYLDGFAGFVKKGQEFKI